MSAPLPTFDPWVSLQAQDSDFDCSQESAQFMLRAWGRSPDDAWMTQEWLSQGIMTPEFGLMDATGGDMASWLNATYGVDGYVASNAPSVTFDDVVAEMAPGNHPVACGGRSFYHWVGIRAYDAAQDLLAIHNSAPGYRGVYQTLSRSQWASLGSWSMVRLTHPEAEALAPAAGVNGPDVASWQGSVDWSAVKAGGAAFGFTKATGGSWYTNPTLAANWAGMKAAGLARGAYHYAFETSGDPFPGQGPQLEADWFLAQVTPLGLEPGDMLVLDIEEGEGDVSGWALAWLQHVEQRVGFKPLLYTGAWFSDVHGFPGRPEMAEYPLWIAAYQSGPPAAPLPWTGYAFWQYTSQATVPGVVGPCDMNAFGGSVAELALYGKPGDVVPPPVYSGIGTGILEMMAEDQTEPAQRASTWLPLGVNPADVESCYGANGTLYTWLLAVGRGWRYPPA